MRAPAKPKPNSADEIARVLRIVRLMEEELRARGLPIYDYAPILEVAERIAARTAD